MVLSSLEPAFAAEKRKPVLADLSLLKAAKIEAKAVEPLTGVAYAELSANEEERLSRLAHELGRCGGFEALPATAKAPFEKSLSGAFGQLAAQFRKNHSYRASSPLLPNLASRAEIETAISQVSEENLKQTVSFLSGFETRVHRGESANRHIEPFLEKLKAATSNAKFPVEFTTISHSSTGQKSIRARIPGASRPQETIVLGAHLDSINQEWFGGSEAPGADDNASGSANLLEALRILVQQKQPERSIEFFWYAGEEGGLLGSAEIARDYKAQNRDVIAVLQLDMTSFPGSGEFVLGSMTDFTSAWLRDYLVAANQTYLKARVVDDQCGYGCSDHASWHRQGYPTLMPFEATFNGMNHKLHTKDDVIDSNTNFHHSAMFSKLALVIAMDLGNSQLREPKF